MYFLSLYAIFKNESHIIKEWIMHYLEEGVEHFYLIDNGSTDDYISQIEPFKDKITIFVDDTKNAQLDLYKKYILPEIHNSVWMIGCDLDEFIWAVDNTIYNLLKEIDDNDHDKKIGLIQIPWEMYGSSGNIDQPKYVIPNFKNRLNYDNSIYINCKSIARTSAVTDLHVHYFVLKNDYIILDSKLEPTFLGPNHDLNEDIIKNAKLRCAHYAIQSYNWFKNVKMTRGDVNSSAYTDIRNDEYFRDYDFNDKFDDSLYNKHKLLYDNLDKEDNIMDKEDNIMDEEDNIMDIEIKENFISPWTPQQQFYISNIKINTLTLIFSLFLFIIICWLLW